MGLALSFWVRTAALACAGAFVLLAGACSENNGDTVRQTPVEGQTTEAGDVVLELSAREYTFVPDRLQMRPDQVAELKVTNPPDDLCFLIAGIRQWQDHVIINLCNSGAVAIKMYYTLPVSLKNGVICFRIMRFHPGKNCYDPFK